MEFNITDDNKIKIGKLIYYYRKNIYKHMSQETFLKNKFNEQICTRQTLSKLEKGSIIKQDRIYEELLQNFHLKYNTKYSIEEIITPTMCSDLLYACDYYQLDTLVELSDNYMKQLEPFTQYVFFYEYYLCMHWIHTYYTDFILPTMDDAHFIISLKEIIHPDLYEVMMDLVFKCKSINSDYDFTYFNYKKSKTIINRGNYMMSLYNKSELNEMYKMCTILEKECISKKNFIRLLDIYTSEGLTLTETETNKFNLLIKKTEDLIYTHKDKIPSLKINQMYKNFGLQSERLKLYNQAIIYLEKYIQSNGLYVRIINVNLCICYEYENKIEKLKQFIKDKELYHGNSQYELLLNYFIYKYNMNYSSILLSDFIVNDVPQILDETMATFKDFFYDELTSLVNETKRYKDIKDFLDATNTMLPK